VRWLPFVTVFLILAAVGAAGLVVLVHVQWPGYEHAAWIAVWSAVTLVAYAVDKAAARAGSDARGRSKRARVSERTLHLLALIGGFAGGWIGRHGLRHKTKKPWFAAVLALGTVLHVALLLRPWWP
jgi:uncharacterized membrane protein YsdA (DUF1294 family)